MPRNRCGIERLVGIRVYQPVAVGDDRFSVSIIPTTLALTTLGSKVRGDPVNLEVDVIAKYVERLMALDHIPNSTNSTTTDSESQS
jgi:riboflavin synthase alpha subunit